MQEPLRVVLAAVGLLLSAAAAGRAAQGTGQPVEGPEAVPALVGRLYGADMTAHLRARQTLERLASRPGSAEDRAALARALLEQAQAAAGRSPAARGAALEYLSLVAGPKEVIGL